MSLNTEQRKTRQGVGFVHEETKGSINKECATTLNMFRRDLFFFFFLNDRKIIGSWSDDGDGLLFFGCSIAVWPPIS
jgi:hypothetical protein